MPQIISFRDLQCWQKALDLAELVYAITEKYPRHERFGLSSHTRKTAVSVPSNIAEGRGRFGLEGFLYHLSVANGSLGELETQLLISERLGYLDQENRQVFDRTAEVHRLLAGMVRALRAKQAAAVTRKPIANSR